MNEIESVRKLLAQTKAGEKGWRRSLTAAEGSYSRTLAEKNLSRLAALRETLLSQLNAANLQLQTGIETSTNHGLMHF